MFGQFSEEARKILVSAKEEMHKLKHPYVGSEHLLLAILKDNNNISKKLKEYNLTYEVLKEEIISIIGEGKEANDWFLYTPLLKRIMENAIIDSKENNNGDVTVEHLFTSLLEEGEGVAIRIMLGMNIDLDKLYRDFSSKLVSVNKGKKVKKLLIDELGYDLTKQASNGELDPVVGREKEIQRTLEILCRRTKNNPILIGEPGVGKTAIVEELSKMIAFEDVPMNLKNKRIISLDMATMVAGTKYRGEFEERMRKIIKEVEDNDDIILFIDEIHTLVGAGGAEGAIDASNIFKPALARGKIRCIGATTTSEYKKYIETDGALDRRFQKILIETPNIDTVKDILLNLRPIYEQFHMVTITDEIIDLIAKLSDKYIYDRNQPDKAIDVLDEVCSFVSLKESDELKKYKTYNKELQIIINNKNDAIIKNDFDVASNYKCMEKDLMDKINRLELDVMKNRNKKTITNTDVAFTISNKTGIPVYELLNEKEKIVEQIDKYLKDYIIGQEDAINRLTSLAKRIKLGFVDENRCTSFMLCGPSGVGKTELAKRFAEKMVGEKNIIRLDMSEYTEAHSVSKIIGAPPGYVGYADSKNILEEIRNKPYSVLILDEIEKANPSIINLLFQILDEGKIKDSKGVEVRFDNVIVIMTSNIGFNDNSIGFSNNKEKIVEEKLKEYFSIPFINRIDTIIMFNNLTRKNIEQIINKKLEKLKNKYKRKQINIKINKNIIDEIINRSNFDSFGARKIDKIIKSGIENQIIENVIVGKRNITISKLLEIINVS
ncbi:MAG: ATP-dependent Clp protease ATP-binding subunit [Firmicutes bacterium]|nr:ATP-dependent Clp protease ATP-binding subunit [Bacillota bacterium]